MSTEQLVQCEGVSRTYGSGHAAVHAVRDASCAIFTAQRIVLMGPSGSGKSTLLHLIAGLDVPTSGSVTWPALGDRATLRPGPVAVVLQGRSLLPPLNVSENVALPLILGGTSADEAGARASAALTRLSLQALGPKLPEELSGGQAQRVAIARAIAQEPRLLLADEPTGQLDRVTAAAVVDLLIEVADETGAALVVGTHEQELAKSFDESWTMSDGLLVAPLPSRLSPDGEPCSA